MKITLRDLIPICILFGILMVGAGFVYDALFVGIPYLDPIPEMSLRFNHHKMIATRIMQIGGLTFAAGVFGAITSFIAGRLIAVRHKTAHEK